MSPKYGKMMAGYEKCYEETPVRNGQGGVATGRAAPEGAWR